MIDDAGDVVDDVAKDVSDALTGSYDTYDHAYKYFMDQIPGDSKNYEVRNNDKDLTDYNSGSMGYHFELHDTRKSGNSKVGDFYVDKEFGTGCVKITPAHDPNDFEVGKRHNLEEINILNDDGTINEKGGKYAGMDRYDARKAMVEDLKAQGLLVKVVPHTHAVGTHDRCHTTVEPMIKQQWFVKMEEMAKPAIEAVKSGKLKFVPERFDKTYFHWLENIHDWCISRQLWWGHRIPAYYCDECGSCCKTRRRTG